MRCPSCGNEVEPTRFCPECGERLEAESAPRRRFVTALFCDVVGSTELGERTDPEVLQATLDAYFAAMRSAIERHGGEVEKFIGDAVVGVFGINAAREDDVIRAARAALEMREAAGALTLDGEALEVRIAIDAGEVYAGVAAAREGRITGDVFNTAARLQSAGSPG
jgi:class 3 adenylate cyclase